METQVRVSAAVATSTTRIPACTRAACRKAPVGPPSTATTAVSAPSADAARAMLRGLPPAQRTASVGRWISPSRRSGTT